MTVSPEVEIKRRGRPKVNSASQKELDKTAQQLDAFESEVKTLTLDRMNMAPKEDVEIQTKLSSEQISKSKDIYLKPKKILGPGVNPKTGEKEKFNEKFREDWNFAKEYVQFIAENRELIGSDIQDIWTKPFPGVNCESWDVPCNKPVWGPRYLAEQIKACSYHRLSMNESKGTLGSDGYGTYTGSIVVDSTVQRHDAMPVSTKKSIFMGANSFA